MDYSVDVKYEYENAKKVFLRYSLIFSSIFTLVLLGDTLLVILAGEDYLINLIVAIAISVLFGWFAIFFFSIMFNDINARYRYFKGYESGIKPTDEVVFIHKFDELGYVNGLYVYPIAVRYFEGLEQKDKIIYGRMIIFIIQSLAL